MGVKTRQAIRSVLNNLRDEVNALLQDGLLEEAEGTEIAGVSGSGCRLSSCWPMREKNKNIYIYIKNKTKQKKREQST